ncbi:MAG: 5-carboxymethyl-2-hydroxymuconate Delta-isomerase [Gammaproteobacteria bacterium]|nr:5-carboxymethyl-2-hydroxymuconate Delta-isomerase [Gammaproteobacteria bacterium]
MAHLTLEYSANLRAGGDFHGLCARLAACLAGQRIAGQAVFPLGGIRVRAMACEDYCIADGAPDGAFVHAILKMGAGRSAAVRTAAGNALFEVIKQHFAAQFAAQGLALSLEVSEFSEAGTWKHNNLHQRSRPS